MPTTPVRSVRERGAALTETALFVLLICVISFTAVKALGAHTRDAMAQVPDAFMAAGPAEPVATTPSTSPRAPTTTSTSPATTSTPPPSGSGATTPAGSDATPEGTTIIITVVSDGGTTGGGGGSERTGKGNDGPGDHEQYGHEHPAHHGDPEID